MPRRPFLPKIMPYEPRFPVRTYFSYPPAERGS